jgi:hypothetical protein
MLGSARLNHDHAHGLKRAIKTTQIMAIGLPHYDRDGTWSLLRPVQKSVKSRLMVKPRANADAATPASTRRGAAPQRPQ